MNIFEHKGAVSVGVLHSTDVKGERFITMRYKFIAID